MKMAQDDKVKELEFQMQILESNMTADMHAGRLILAKDLDIFIRMEALLEVFKTDNPKTFFLKATELSLGAEFNLSSTSI